ncbi:MAG: hypothetical protein Q8S21_03770 [Candidatus Paracaedibacteraceae bacterium]|nr:hypothetical protein [Candidatus Paracaedibacteraceae bacterium]
MNLIFKTIGIIFCILFFSIKAKSAEDFLEAFYRDRARQAAQALIDRENELKAQQAAIDRENELRAQQAAIQRENELRDQQAAIQRENELRDQQAAIDRENELRDQQAAIHENMLDADVTDHASDDDDTFTNPCSKLSSDVTDLTDDDDDAFTNHGTMLDECATDLSDDNRTLSSRDAMFSVDETNSADHYLHAADLANQINMPDVNKTIFANFDSTLNVKDFDDNGSPRTKDGKKLVADIMAFLPPVDYCKILGEHVTDPSDNENTLTSRDTMLNERATDTTEHCKADLAKLNNVLNTQETEFDWVVV